MSKRIVIDPVTRIEGHLRIDVEVDGGRVNSAWASGTMWRGIEQILVGRDPREAWIFAQRFCGVCTTVHAISSVRAVEDALGLVIPKNAQYIRNLILIAHALHDHIVHFYHLCALDWVDVVSALKADPAKTSSLAETLSPWMHNSKNELKGVQDKLKGLRRSVWANWACSPTGIGDIRRCASRRRSTCSRCRITCRRSNISGRRIRSSRSWAARRRTFRIWRWAACS